MKNLNREDIIKNFLPKIKYIALNLLSTLPKNVELDDLIQEGIIGLLQSLDKYNPNKGVTFYSFAVKRIRGAMLDYLRKIDWLPKDLRHKIKKLEEILAEQNIDDYISDEELAEQLEISVKDVKKLKAELHRSQILSLDSYLIGNNELNVESDNEENDPEILAYKDMLKQELKKAILSLNEKEQLILSLYYEKELTFKEIGKILEISESRVSQIHSAIIAKLKKKLGGD
ncbi:RNA polymerase subunit sigma-28 [Marinitoga sp. 1135]|uniref:RNA polymerase sigma factor n=1 Tax=Marinitoga piezophila (strain DSM 14283 / JCM 11233 / KA3) TaxID=443254 RepID=H2J6H8_MARPK|nr:MULTISPECIES: FliA/WhiG family RNA polymerase sigma factor [Marinitoga]AEX85163.1 RNA polymerase sigma factor, FliA/WhiG family [Marinitoga piezophila KA3]APT75660.1 RNA polymerase subunit sigma-28 [Marinitoga sp. 1137]NUU95399.1 RNA polymerase subunit sigma-28 [Marinitoga sp. 1135]NUU97327.1 RNA polymerase subunit sigma-28 [Marinitoga sp. 1138]